MVDLKIKKYAKLIVEYSVGVTQGDLVRIRGSTEATPIIKQTYKEVIRNGGHPYVQAVIGGLDDIFYRYAKEHQLEYISPISEFLIESLDVDICFTADINTRNLSNVDPEKIRRTSSASREIMTTYMQRAAEGSLRWVGAPFPTDALAQEASMSLLEYEEFVFSSCLCDRDDPTAEWKRISLKQENISKALNKISELRIVGEDTDLTLSVDGRSWINCAGKENLPDGEIFTGPIEDSATGKIRFTYPGIYRGREVEDIFLEFHEGVVVNASATKGEDLMQKMLDVDEGARQIGEVAIGTNPLITRFTKNMLFDEKMGGTIHLALGAAWPESGGKNESAIHWDILKDMKINAKLYGDGELIYEDGDFVKGFGTS